MSTIFRNKKTGRVCYAFPWESQKAPCPWNQEKYERVVTPLTDKEKQHAGKGTTVHIQVVRRDKLELVKPTRLKLH